MGGGGEGRAGGDDVRGRPRPAAARLARGRRGLEAAVAALPVYRTYIRDLPAREDLWALREAGLVEWLGEAPKPFVTRFQQTTPPVMAKGVEDTAFYRYLRLLALNDVGGDPSRFGIDVETFHAGNAERAARFPRTLLCTQTHDTKRSGDVRARLGALAELAGEWVAGVRAWRELCAPLREDGVPDPVEEYLIFQTLVGAWPLEPERLAAYLEKALREAKRATNWIAPDAAHERRVQAYARALYDHAPFRAAFEPFAERLAIVGELHSLRQTALKLTVPGVPDLYQGDELEALSLVDPDNRRPVDWHRRAALLGELRDGALPGSRDARKLWLIHALLALRARRPETFDAGGYTPLDAGPDAVAFLRGDAVAVAMPIREGGLDLDLLALPDGDWAPVFDPDRLAGAEIHVLERSLSGGNVAAARARPGTDDHDRAHAASTSRAPGAATGSAAFAYFADDVRFRVPGRSEHAGERRGRDAARAYIEHARRLSGEHEVEVELVDLLAGETRVALIVHEVLPHRGRSGRRSGAATCTAGRTTDRRGLDLRGRPVRGRRAVRRVGHWPPSRIRLVRAAPALHPGAHDPDPHRHRRRLHGRGARVRPRRCWSTSPPPGARPAAS